jgi:hypothetical protein
VYGPTFATLRSALLLPPLGFDCLGCELTICPFLVSPNRTRLDPSHAGKSTSIYHNLSSSIDFNFFCRYWYVTFPTQIVRSFILMTRHDIPQWNQIRTRTPPSSLEGPIVGLRGAIRAWSAGSYNRITLRRRGEAVMACHSLFIRAIHRFAVPLETHSNPTCVLCLWYCPSTCGL